MAPYTIIEEKKETTTVKMDTAFFHKIQKMIESDLSFFEVQELSQKEKKALEKSPHFQDFDQAFNQIKI